MSMLAHRQQIWIVDTTEPGNQFCGPCLWRIARIPPLPKLARKNAWTAAQGCCGHTTTPPLPNVGGTGSSGVAPEVAAPSASQARQRSI